MHQQSYSSLINNYKSTKQKKWKLSLSSLLSDLLPPDLSTLKNSKPFMQLLPTQNLRLLKNFKFSSTANIKNQTHPASDSISKDAPLLTVATNRPISHDQPSPIYQPNNRLELLDTLISFKAQTCVFKYLFLFIISFIISIVSWPYLKK